MKVDKQKLQVKILLENNSLISGFVHINPGERLRDFINGSRELFIAVTEADTSYSGTHPAGGSSIIHGDIILNKSSMIWIKEASKRHTNE